MSHPHTIDAAPDPKWLVLLMAAAAGTTCSAMYYHQPMLAVLGMQLDIPKEHLGWIPASIWAGYALGILLLAPLGDRFDPKRLMLFKLCVLVLTLVGAAFAPDYRVLVACCFVQGIFTTVAQDLIPFAAKVVPAEMRGRAIGTVTSGILIGGLYGRIAGGLVADAFGWRMSYAMGAAMVAVVLPLLARRLPAPRPSTDLGYVALIASTFALLGRYPALRKATLTQAMLFSSYGVLWATVATMYQANFGLSPMAAGLLGIPAVAGALAMPWLARQVQRHGPSPLAWVGIGLVTFAWLGMGLMQSWALLVALGVLMLDVGLRCSLAAQQSIIFSLDASAQSRINSVFVTALFGSQAIGAYLANAAWVWGGWTAVAVTGGFIGSLAVLFHRR